MVPLRKMRRKSCACMALFCLCCCVAAVAVLSGGRWPVASGDKVLQKGSLTVDASHVEEGYIMAKGKASSSKLKLRIALGETICTYDLNGSGEYETFPLQLGSGSYKCSLYKNIKGNKYSTEGSVSFKVKLEDENIAFLYPNQYVNYGPENPAVQLSAQICEGLESDEEKFAAIRDYVKQNFLYDFVKATTVPAGSMPDIETCINTRMGICQDLTAMVACMMRVQGIPCKMVIGYADRSYHAWNSALVNGEWQMLDVTAELKGISSGVTYTVERCY